MLGTVELWEGAVFSQEHPAGTKQQVALPVSQETWSSVKTNSPSTFCIGTNQPGGNTAVPSDDQFCPT